MYRLSLIALTAIAVPTAAFAQENRDIRVRAGLGAEWRPQFPGAKSNEWAPQPSFGIARGDAPFRFGAPDDGFSPAIVSSGGFRFGPAAALVGKRTDKDVGAPLGRVGRTVEVGAYAAYELADSLRLRGMVRKGIGGHEGVTASLGVDQIWRQGDDYVISVGPRLLWSDGRYQRSFFGVSPTAALASGLPAYRPSSGFHAAAVQGGLHHRLSGPFGLFGQARFERLIGDAARSPVVRTLGDRNQWSVGGGLTYTFTVRRRPEAD